MAASRVPLALVVFVSATSKKSMVSEVNRRCSEYTLDGCRYFSRQRMAHQLFGKIYHNDGNPADCARRDR